MFSVSISPKAYETHLLPLEYMEAFTTIYLGISSNILSVDDRKEPLLLGIENETFIVDCTATLYLGKIIFEKNEQGNLAPKYIPSQISELDFENLNPFWLNEINPNSKKPFKSMIECEDHWEVGKICRVNPKAYEYQKIYYYRNKHNITLNKEQILSYFIELHTKNTILIKDYINTINQNKGIKAYTNIESYYDKLAKEGIIPPKLLSKYNDGTYKQNKEADLIVLDYLKSNNEADSMILLNDELFYAYLVWSLREYLISSYKGKFQDEHKLLFNKGAYKSYKDEAIFEKTFINATTFYSNLFDSYKEYTYTAIPTPKYQFKTPNKPKFSDDEPRPSPLGNYYFELSDNPDTYIEYFQRIYPSITNPPKAWTKQMLKKLDLKLE